MANISKIHLLDESILGLRASGILIGRTDSTSTATVQTATVPGLTELFDGMFMFIYNSTIASASGWTLNINGLGAKQVYNSQNARTTTGFAKNTWFPLIYDGVNDRFVIGYITDNNTTYSNVSLGQGYGTCTTAAATAAKVVSLSSYALTVNGIVAVKFTNDVPANATMNINSKGAKAIYHRGAAITDGVIKGGDTAYFIYNTYYHLLGVDRIPDTNNMVTSSSSLTANQIVLGNGDKTIKGSDYTIIGPDALIWDDGETQIPTYEAVQSYLAELPEPMIFQGTLGTGGTITTLPAAAAGNTGYTYKVITNGIYQSIAAKAGDTFISNGSSWTLIPSGDEPGGTVTNIATGTGLTGGPITTTGTISIDTTTVATKSDIPTTLDQIADGSTRKLSDYLPLTGGDMESGAYIRLNSSVAENEISSSYINIQNKNTNAYAEYGSSNFLYSPDGNDEYTIRFPQNDGTIALTSDINTAVSSKQDTLVSGTNIKTINNQSLLGSGNITIGNVGIETIVIDTDGTWIEDWLDEQGSLPSGTYSRAINASQQGKLVVLDFAPVSDGDSYFFVLVQEKDLTSSEIIFESYFDTTSFTLRLSDDDTVSYSSLSCELLTNKVTSISSSSTNTQYPSAKATYDAITAVTTESLTTAEIDTIWNNAS